MCPEWEAMIKERQEAVRKCRQKQVMACGEEGTQGNPKEGINRPTCIRFTGNKQTKNSTAQDRTRSDQGGERHFCV